MTFINHLQYTQQQINKLISHSRPISLRPAKPQFYSHTNDALHHKLRQFTPPHSFTKHLVPVLRSCSIPSIWQPYWGVRSNAVCCHTICCYHSRTVTALYEIAIFLHLGPLPLFNNIFRLRCQAARHNEDRVTWQEIRNQSVIKMLEGIGFGVRNYVKRMFDCS
jgi:hypothetical protein